MLKLNNDKSSIADVFGVTKEDVAKLYRISKGFHRGMELKASNILMRIWIDEMMSDNIKCWAIFEFGRWYGHYERDETHDETGRD